MTHRWTCEDFWRQCFHLLPPERKAEILFNFPYRGSDQWFPTWTQVQSWPARDSAYQHKRFQSSPELMKNILGDTSFFISNLWTIPRAILHETDKKGEYEVNIGGSLFGFYLPYLPQKPDQPSKTFGLLNDKTNLSIPTNDKILPGNPVFTLATMDIGQAHNWVVCRELQRKLGTDVGLVGVAEVNVLKKVGVMRTDAGSELLVGGENGTSLLRRMDCLFV